MGLVDWLYPKRCVGCKKEGRFFCQECLRQIRVRRDYVCPECNHKSIGGMVHLGCKKDHSLDGLISLLNYQGMVRLGVHELKYKMIREIEKEFLSIFTRVVKKEIKKNQVRGLVDFLRHKPVVVPVPLHWRRENFRGFNQAEMVGRILVEGFSVEMITGWLVRNKKTQQQTKLDKKERQQNVREVFKVKRNMKIKRVLLVDDVWTTGATMRACTKVLKKSGVSQVWGLTLAR